MKRYLRVYRAYAKISLQTLLAYRGNFVNNLISTLSWGLFSFVSIYLLTSKASTVYGWTRDELILLTCGYQILIGIFHTLFSRNFERMAETINLAQLDSFLLKPLDSQFVLSMRWVNFLSLIRIVVGLGFSIYVLEHSTLPVSPWNVLFFAFLLGVSIILLYSIWYVVVTLIIWYPRMSNVVELMYSVSGMTRYPGEMYRNAMGPFFAFMIPIVIIMTTPVRALLSKVTLWDVSLLFVLAGMFFYASRKFWKFALRHYTSASS